MSEEIEESQPLIKRYTHGYGSLNKNLDTLDQPDSRQETAVQVIFNLRNLRKMKANDNECKTPPINVQP